MPRPAKPSRPRENDGTNDDPDSAYEAAASRRFEAIGASGEGQVVGMDLDPHLSREERVSRGDPHVLSLIESVGKLAESLRRRGEAGLHATPEMSRFEATLRAYCVGYLAGRRAQR